jgi:acetyl-CoA acetyltransferase
MSERTLRGKTAIVGVGETTYYKHGKAPDPEFKMCVDAILAACEDGGINPKDIDGFSAYADERSTSNRLASALGIKDMRFSTLLWGGGGGGGAGAVGNAAAAVACGVADCVVVYRSLAQGQYRRFGGGHAGGVPTVSGDVGGDYMSLLYPYGVISPAQQFAMKVRRFMHEHGVQQEALRAIAMASYHHAQLNPRAVMYGKPLTEEAYDRSRWIVEPFHLFDCCMENDGAAALIVVSAERARDMKQKPAYVLGALQGSEHRHAARGHNSPIYASSSFTRLAPRLYEMARCTPGDIDVAQVYENFTGGVLMSLVEHGFFTGDEANVFCKLENFSGASARLPLNTSGGNLAHCYMHGLELQIEAVRQLRGQSTAQVENAKHALVVAGPMVSPATTMILGSEEVL